MLFCYKKGRTWLFSWHFYGCCTLFLFGFWWEGEKKSTEMFCKFFFNVLLGFFFSEERSGTICCKKSNWTFFLLLNLPLILLFSILESKYENLHNRNVYKNWLILGGIGYSLFIWICTCPTLQKAIKDKNVLVSLLI